MQQIKIPADFFLIEGTLEKITVKKVAHGVYTTWCEPGAAPVKENTEEEIKELITNKIQKGWTLVVPNFFC